MLYKLVVIIVRFFLSCIYRMKIIGEENIPQESGVIIAPNHRSNWDVPMATVFIKRQLTFMAKESLFRVPVFGWLIKTLGAFPIKRGKGDIQAIKSALELLSSDHAMLMFPEGTRSRTGDMLVPKSGSVYLAVKAGVPIVPVAITGNYIPFTKMEVRYGKPLDLKSYYKQKVDTEILEQLSNQWTEAVKKLKS